MKNFALIGAAGFIAPRHLKAIKETKNHLIAALDKFDQVGVLDSYFPEADFFTEFERFDRHLDKLKRAGTKIDYVSICTPNYLHDAHIRFALRHHADAICEKPLVLNPWNAEALEEIEKETGQRIYNILQLRLHKNIIELKREIENEKTKRIHDIDLTYITSRGNWYFSSWKGDITKSGGVATNIGIHFFDMLIWVYGDVKSSVTHSFESTYASGFIELERARVRWFLSISSDHLPAEIKEKGQRTYRSIQMENKEIEFSEGFTDLHTESYRNIIAGEGFGIRETRKAIEVAYNIRTQKPVGAKGDYHPLLKNV